MKVTPETLTDAMVREFMPPASVTFGGFEWQRRRECEWALVKPHRDDEARERVSLARQRICDAINARAAKVSP